LKGFLQWIALLISSIVWFAPLYTIYDSVKNQEFDMKVSVILLLVSFFFSVLGGFIIYKDRELLNDVIHPTLSISLSLIFVVSFAIFSWFLSFVTNGKISFGSDKTDHENKD